ncbi:MAG: hypothetical protein PVH62_02295 [Anaerolineae bacterium]|jgi:hypothetical protein
MAQDRHYSPGVEGGEVAAEIGENVAEKEARSSWGKIGMNALYGAIMLVVFLIVLYLVGAVFQGGAILFVLTIAITGAVGKALRRKMFG